MLGYLNFDVSNNQVERIVRALEKIAKLADTLDKFAQLEFNQKEKASDEKTNRDS